VAAFAEDDWGKTFVESVGAANADSRGIDFRTAFRLVLPTVADGVSAVHATDSSFSRDV
jgi:hypothetical protein